MSLKDKKLYIDIAHSLYEIFQVIQGNIEKLITKKGFTSAVWEDVTSIYDAIHEGKHLINQMLEIEPKDMKFSDRKDILGRGETILFVDDNKQICKLYSPMLEAFGYKVIVAKKGKTAIEIFCKNPEIIDIVVLDVKLPDISGFECVESIIECFKDVKLILSTGYLELNIDPKYIDNILYKPYSIIELMSIIRRVLDE
ncbi:MAG: response regulator [Fermentimonas sp.]